MIGHSTWAVVALGTILAGGAQGQPETSAKQPPQKDWNTRTSLPSLLAKALTPVKERENFERRSSSVWYRRPGGPVADGQGFATDEEAKKAAQAFLRDHFGELSVSVFPTRVSPADGRSRSAGDPDLWITLESVHHGIPLDGCGAVVYFSGRTVVSASVTLVSVTPIQESERRILSKEQAIAAWEKWKQQGPKEWKDLKPDPKRILLKYVWSPGDSPTRAPGGTEEFVLRPNWVIGNVLIDAFTGKAWRNG